MKNNDESKEQFLIFKVSFPSLEVMERSMATVNIMGMMGVFGNGMNGTVVDEEGLGMVFFFDPNCHHAGNTLSRTFEKAEAQKHEGIKLVELTTDDIHRVEKTLAKTQLQMDGEAAGNVNLN